MRVQSSYISTACGKTSCAFPVKASSVAKKRSSTWMQPRRQLTAGVNIRIVPMLLVGKAYASVSSVLFA